jgi:DNA-binding response OmpR family regulator
MENRTCYLIDDDDEDRQAFETALYSLDEPFRLITASNGVEALKTLSDEEDFTPDYIFLDLHMPIVDGKYCLSEIKKITRLKDVPVAMYTTTKSNKDMEDLRKLGATVYINKSHSLAALEASLDSFFKQYSSTL